MNALPASLSAGSELIAWSAELLTLAARFGNARAVSDAHAAISYTELARHAHALAGRLRRQGIVPGQSVGTLLPNSVAAVWTSYGVTLAGACETPMSWTYTEAEIRWASALAGCRFIVTTQPREAQLRGMGFDVMTVGETDVDCAAAAHAPVPADVWGRILFSSGTTGKPKGVVYSHGRRWLGNQLLKSVLPWMPQPGSRILLMTPFTHGASLLTFAWLDSGGEVILSDGVDTQRIEAIMAPGDVEALFAPPTVIAKLSDTFGARRFAGVRCVFTGTQTLTPALYRKAEAMFGPVVRITYGKTECTNPITVLGPVDTRVLFSAPSNEAGACVGWPVAGVELSVRSEDGAELPAGGTGEVWLRARHMYVGHIDPDGFHPVAGDGWHRSGDFGHIDRRGRLWLEGRVADVIKSGGYKILPDEIEAELSGLSECGEICIASLPSEYWGEVIVAAAEGASSDWQAEAERRVALLSRHKRPRLWLTLAALPRNAQGKVSRKEVRARILARYELVDGPYPRLAPRAAP
ncbi:MAG: acyl--CoA ligase [Betaproteobacteria bacterium]|nr:acyl--CoA ligase [Betaproteobacteria bacterium]